MLTANTANFILCLMLLGTSGCGWFQKGNKANQVDRIEQLQQRDAEYCALSKPIYESHGKTTDKDCDAALFTSLHGLKCGYVDPSVFEFENSGKLCRRPGCTCFPRREGFSQSDSGFSKDMATGMQVYYSAKPDKELAKRVQSYGVANKWTVCDAETTEDLVGKCLMSSKIIYRWSQIEKKGAEQQLEPEEPVEDDQKPNVSLTQNTEFRAHLDILGIIVEWNLYKAISDEAVKTIKAQAEREPNNLLYQAMLARFVTGNVQEVAERLLAKFPSGRLPTSDDWCTSYLYQRDETRAGVPNKDWLPCDRSETHQGTDYLLASWVIQN